jgi:hypothetical protein
MKLRIAEFVTLAAGIMLAGCGQRKSLPPADSVITAAPKSTLSCDAPAIRDVVTTFGAQLQKVSLLAPDSILRSSIRSEYSAYVTPELLQQWLASRDGAPGRRVSSPWPARIETGLVTEIGADECRVTADVVYESSAPGGSASMREAVSIGVTRTDPPLISAYTTAGAEPEASAPDSSDPKAVIISYYDDIDARNFDAAYALWASKGAASKQSLEQFRNGFSQTASVKVRVGEPGRIEGAAGSRYVDIPVTVESTLKSGARQTFSGTYTLRRAVVDGATAEQRSWRIYSATISRDS